METQIALTTEESARLKELEFVVERGKQTFIEVGMALMEIKEKELWRYSHSSFIDYCEKRWGFKKTHAYRLVESAQVAIDISPVGEILNEGTAREFVSVSAEDRPAVAEAAKKIAEEQGRDTINSRDVKEAKAKVKFEDKVQKQREEADRAKQEINSHFSLDQLSANPLEPDDWYLVDTWQAIESRIDLFINEGTSKGSFNDQTGDSIEWARWSWNPVTGCEHGCPYCYARDIANRFYDQKFMPSLWPNRINIPRSMNVPGIASEDVSYKNVFTCSMADLFGRWVPLKWITLVMDSVRKSPEWNFLFLTKFPQRISELGELPQNAWMGTSVDCQDRVANAEKAFAKIGGGTKWLSIEPMLTPLKFNRLDLFDWVVIGGASESVLTPEWVPPMDWIVDLHKQAREAGCKVYYKSNLKLPAELRIKEFPWTDRPERKLPDAMKYLGIK